MGVGGGLVRDRGERGIVKGLNVVRGWVGVGSVRGVIGKGWGSM